MNPTGQLNEVNNVILKIHKLAAVALFRESRFIEKPP